MKKAHLIYVPFTGLGKINRGDKWLENRIQIFKQFVLASLLKQSTLNYVLWISWRPEDEDNKIVRDFQRHMQTLKGLTVVFTFNGLCFFDDKYSDEEGSKRLSINLTKTLPYLKNHVDWADEVIMTIQPSDDIYMTDVFEKIQSLDFKKFAGFTKGYIINYNTKEICEYNPDTIPPFFSIKFKTDVFLDPQKHFYWTGPYVSHEYVTPFKEIPGRGFIVGTHGENISTTWNIPFKGKRVDNQEFMWLKSGILFVPPLKLKPSRNYNIRKIYNALPKFIRIFIRLIYDFKKRTLQK